MKLNKAILTAVLSLFVSVTGFAEAPAPAAVAGGAGNPGLQNQLQQNQGLALQAAGQAAGIRAEAGKIDRAVTEARTKLAALQKKRAAEAGKLPLIADTKRTQIFEVKDGAAPMDLAARAARQNTLATTDDMFSLATNGREFKTLFANTTAKGLADTRATLGKLLEANQAVANAARTTLLAKDAQNYDAFYVLAKSELAKLGLRTPAGETPAFLSDVTRFGAVTPAPTPGAEAPPQTTQHVRDSEETFVSTSSDGGGDS